MNRRLIAYVALLLVFTLLISGCVDRKQIKSDAEQALSHHTLMKNYHFTGSAVLDLDAPENGWSSNPLANALLSMLTKGNIEWEGVAAIEPLQLEATLRIGQGDAMYKVPLLIKDNTMYIHIPALNMDNQYFEINLDELSAMAGSSNTGAAAGQIQASGELFSGIMADIVASIDPRRFEETKSGTDRTITMTLTDKQKNEAVELWNKLLPLAADRLEQAGYLTTGSADKLKSSTEKQKNDLTLNKPIVSSITIDSQGFATEMNVSLDLAMKSTGGETRQWKAEIVNRYDDINAAPPFTMEVPEDIRPFTDILKLLSALNQ